MVSKPGYFKLNIFTTTHLYDLQSTLLDKYWLIPLPRARLIFKGQYLISS